MYSKSIVIKESDLDTMTVAEIDHWILEAHSEAQTTVREWLGALIFKRNQRFMEIERIVHLCLTGK